MNYGVSLRQYVRLQLPTLPNSVCGLVAIVCGFFAGCMGGHVQPPEKASKVVSEIKVFDLQIDGTEPQGSLLKKSFKHEIGVTGSVEVPAEIPAVNVMSLFSEFRVHAYNKAGFRIHSLGLVHVEDRNFKDADAAKKLKFHGSIECPEVKGRYELCYGVLHSIPGTFDIAKSVFYRTVVEAE